MAYEEAVIMGSSAFLFIIFYLSTKISGKMTILRKETLNVEIFQPFFLIFGIVYSLFHLDLMIRIATANAATEIAEVIEIVYAGVSWIVLPLFVFYFIISFIYNLIRSGDKQGLQA